MAEKVNGKGPAFPYVSGNPGMNLRYWTAVEAAKGILASGTFVKDETGKPIGIMDSPGLLADKAFAIADALIERSSR